MKIWSIRILINFVNKYENLNNFILTVQLIKNDDVLQNEWYSLGFYRLNMRDHSLPNLFEYKDPSWPTDGSRKSFNWNSSWEDEADINIDNRFILTWIAFYIFVKPRHTSIDWTYLIFCKCPSIVSDETCPAMWTLLHWREYQHKRTEIL